jgi:site-specific recombinase XerD
MGRPQGPWSKSQIPVRTFPMGGEAPWLCGNGSGGSLRRSSRWKLSVHPDADGSGHRLDRMPSPAGEKCERRACRSGTGSHAFSVSFTGHDTDSSWEFLNAEVIAYCEQEQLTFTCGRPGVKNDQAHVEQKNGAVVHEAVGCMRLVGMQAYTQLREVYRALRLVVNCFQPSRHCSRLSVEAVPTRGRRPAFHGVFAVLGERPAPRAVVADWGDTDGQHGGGLRAFCNWLAQQGYVSETLFPKDAIPQTQQGLPQPVEPEAFVRLLRACQLPGPPGGPNASMTARNRAILWLLLDTGLRVSEVCGLCLVDVDYAGGTVTVRGKGGHARTFSLSADGKRALCAYLHQARLTPAWEPAVPEARDRLLLTEQRHPLSKNSLTLLFVRLSQRAGFTRTSICPSMLHDTYAIRFLQTGGEPHDLQEQLGVAGLASVRRYQRFCDKQCRRERSAQEDSEESLFTQHSSQGKSKHQQERRRGRGRRPSS